MFSKFLGSDQEALAKDDDASLTTILPTPALRIEFILLVMLHADAMHGSLAAAFDVAQLSSSPRPRPADRRVVDSEDAPPSYFSATEGRGRSDYDRRTEELEDPGIQELKRASLRFLRSWRVDVLKRMGNVLNVRSDDVLRMRQRREAEKGPSENEERHSAGARQKAIPTTLVQLDEAKRMLLLDALLMLLLSLESYLAHSRVLLLRVAASLQLPTSTLVDQENKIAQGLLSAAESQVSADDETKRQATATAGKRAWKVGLATVAGAALIGVTGGLAAPLLAAGVGTVMGGLGLGSTAVAGLLGALASNVVLVGGLFGAYGGRMTGQMMDRYAKEIEDFKFLPMLEVAQDQHRLRVAIGISGWLNEKEDVSTPWKVFGSDLEAFALQWELATLLNLGSSLMTFAKSYAWDYASTEIIKRTVLGTLAAGFWPLGILRIASIVDNPFSIAKIRSEKAGKVLADALINKAQGERPVTLVGYSLGARVIYSCLQSLAERRAFGLVEAAVFLGAPTPSDAPDWRRIRAVVSGRVVNVYSVNDFILGILYRTSSIQLGIAGLEEVKDVAGVENFDASSLVSGHQRYQFLVGAIMKELGFEDLDPVALQREAALLEERDAVIKEAKKKGAAGTKERAEESSDAQWVRASDLEDEDARDLGAQDIERKVQSMRLGEERDGKTHTSSHAEHEEHLGERIMMFDDHDESWNAGDASNAKAQHSTQSSEQHETRKSTSGASRPATKASDPLSESEDEMLHVAPYPVLEDST